MYRVIAPRAKASKRPPEQVIHPYFAIWHQWGDSGAAFTLLLLVLRLAGWLALKYRRPQKKQGADKEKEKKGEEGKPAEAAAPAPAPPAPATGVWRAVSVARHAVWALFPLTVFGAVVLL